MNATLQHSAAVVFPFSIYSQVTRCNDVAAPTAAARKAAKATLMYHGENSESNNVGLGEILEIVFFNAA